MMELILAPIVMVVAVILGVAAITHAPWDALLDSRFGRWLFNLDKF